MGQSIIFLVRDDQGVGVGQAQVSCSFGSAYTDSNGSASIAFTNSNVANTYAFTITKAGYKTVVTNQSIPLYNQTVPVTLSLNKNQSAAGFKVSDRTNPISGARLFLNGVSTAISDANGHFVFYLNDEVNHINIEAGGYAAKEIDLDPAALPDVIYLIPLVSSQQFLQLVISPPETTYVLATESGTVGSDSQVVTQNQYSPGNYTVTWTFGSATRTDTFTVTTGKTLYSFAPLPVTDDGSTNTGIPFSDGAAAAATVSQPGSNPTSTTAIAPSSSPVPAAIPESAYEFVAPSLNYGRYFTATQARLYMGDLFIEELAGCQFVLQGNKIPVYGYCSSEFDAIGSGRYLVTGQLMLHFISEGYLYTALNEYKRRTQIDKDTNVATFTNLLNAESAVKSNAFLSPDERKQQLAQLQDQRTSLIAKDPSILTSYQRSQISSLSIDRGPNALYSKIPFDLQVQFEGGGRIVNRKITNCFLTSNEKILGDNDSNVLDCYGFIGRRLL